MKPQAVFFIAPPGAGKGTQANLLVEKFGWIHLESSKVIEQKFKNADPNDEVINREKKRREEGFLMDTKLITGWMMEEFKALAEDQKSFVSSGSPRILYEAENELPFVRDLYDNENITVLHINLPDEVAIDRNSHRRWCSGKGRHTIPNTPEYKDITKCPWDDSDIITRADDNAEAMKLRLEEYRKLTEPILAYAKEHDYTVVEINGNQDIEKVHEDIVKLFE